MDNKKYKQSRSNERVVSTSNRSDMITGRSKYNLDFIDWNNEWERVSQVEIRINNGESIEDKEEENRVRRHMKEMEMMNENKIKVEDYPIVKLKDLDLTKECYICLNKFNKIRKVRLLPCSHMFCENCIRPWLKTDSVCPTCKYNLDPNKEDEN